MENFKPEDHLMKVKGKDYLEVKWRLVWFRAVHPEGIIQTQLLNHNPELGLAVFKASVWIREGGQAEAHGSETKSDFGDYLEKAETKAIGRALAMLGFGTQFTADELDEGERIVDAPVEKPTKTKKAPKTKKPAKPDNPKDEAVKEEIRALCKGLSWTKTDLNKFCQKHLKKEVKDLTDEDRAELASQLNKYVDEGAKEDK